jgi:hypothetical protein
VRTPVIAPVLCQLCWVNGGRRLVNHLVADETMKLVADQTIMWLSQREGKKQQLTRCGLLSLINCWVGMDDLAAGWLAMLK